jgi:hypothetical protein
MCKRMTSITKNIYYYACLMKKKLANPIHNTDVYGSDGAT